MKSHLLLSCAISQLLLFLKEADSFVIVAATENKCMIRQSSPTTALAMVSRDEFMRPHFHASSIATRPETDMGQIVECADGSGNCSIEEMISMVEELDRLNRRCKDESSDVPDCDVEAVDARETIRHALETQIELTTTRNKMKNMDVIQEWSSSTQVDGSQQGSEREDHSFDHFVDYRAIGEYESH